MADSEIGDLEKKFRSGTETPKAFSEETRLVLNNQRSAALARLPLCAPVRARARARA